MIGQEIELESIRKINVRDLHQDIQVEEDLLPDSKREEVNLIKGGHLHTLYRERHPGTKLLSQIILKEQRVTEVKTEEKEIKVAEEKEDREAKE